MEARVVLSHVAPAAPKVAPAVPLVTGAPTPGQNDLYFGTFCIRDTTLLGHPVYEQRVTDFADGSRQVDDRLILPNNANHTTITADWFNLRNNGGVEKIVDVATTAGNTTAHVISTTLPDGSIRTEVDLDVTSGNTTVIKGTIVLPSGSYETVTGSVVQSNAREQITDRSVTAPDGTVVSRSHTVTDMLGTFNDGNSLQQNDTATTLVSGGAPQTSKSLTNVTRFNAPGT
jgi:hypothetical protein